MSDEDTYIELFGAQLFINKRKEIGYWRAYRNLKSNIVFRDESAPLLNLAPPTNSKLPFFADMAKLYILTFLSLKDTASLLAVSEFASKE